MLQEERRRAFVWVRVRAKARTGSRASCSELCHHEQFLLVSHTVKRDNTVILKHLKIWG